MLQAPLSVRINDGYTDRHVTTQASRLQFRKVANGGFHSLSVRLDLPRDFFRDLGPTDRITIYDARTGAVIMEGLTENPGASSGRSGQAFDLSAMGTMVYAQDQTRALIYIDRDQSHWDTATGPDATLGGRSSVTTDPTVDDPAPGAPTGQLLQIGAGTTIGTGQYVAINYHQLAKTGQTLGGIHMWLLSGKTDTGYDTNLSYGGTGGIGQVAVGDPAAITDDQWLYDAIAGADINTPPQWPELLSLLLSRTGGATNVADELTWSWFYDLAVVAARVYRDGTVVPPEEMVSAEYVRADWVVEDLLGRVLTMCDPDTSVVEATTFEIEQLTYLDGATAGQVLDDLADYEPAMTWELLETTPSGKVRFRYRAWPTTARYELIRGVDQYRESTNQIDLCNRIVVTWTDAAGATRTTTVTASVPELGGAPGDPGARIKDAAAVTLPAGQGSAANAQRLGEQILASKASPPKSAVAVVRRPLYDRLTGRMAMPWELEAGFLATEVETGHLLRITEMAYNDDPDPAATLTLGQPELSTQQRIVQLQRGLRAIGGRVA